MKAKRAVVYVDDDLKLDLASSRVDSGVILEVRRFVREGDRISIDPVVWEKDSTGQLATVKTT